MKMIDTEKVRQQLKAIDNLDVPLAEIICCIHYVNNFSHTPLTSRVDNNNFIIPKECHPLLLTLLEDIKCKLEEDMLNLQNRLKEVVEDKREDKIDESK